MLRLNQQSSMGLIGVVALFTIVGVTSAQTDNPLSAEESNPATLGRMTGFPPPTEKLIMHPESDFFSFPKLRWTVCHIRELMPTKQVSRGIGAPIPLEYALDDGIDELTFMPIGSKETMTWKESLSKNYTDGILIIHKGKVVYERYFGCLDETGKHAAMSMTKSLTGLLAEILVVEGQLDDKAKVESIVPELKGSAFGNATVRQVMDMTTALNYSEDYSDPQADIGYIQRRQTHYQNPKTTKVQTVISSISKPSSRLDNTGKLLATILSIRTSWGGLSRESPARTSQSSSLSASAAKSGRNRNEYMTVDAKGTPFAGGGLSAGLRDLGRIGLLMLNRGEINGQRLFSKRVVEKIQAGGDKKAFAKAGYKMLEGGSYRSMWWVFHNKHSAFAARGVHVQTIYIDPTAEIVIVRFASFPTAKNAQIDPTSLPAYQAVAEYLLKK